MSRCEPPAIAATLAVHPIATVVALSLHHDNDPAPAGPWTPGPPRRLTGDSALPYVREARRSPTATLKVA